MAAWIASLLGWQEEPKQPLRPPAQTFTGVRIPVNGSRAHLVTLSTTDPSGCASRDNFLIHVPDLRPYWKIHRAWMFRDIHKLDLQQHDQVETAHHARLKHDLHRLLFYSHLELGGKENLHLRQRHLGDQQRYLLEQRYSFLSGTYYVFYSYAIDDLPENVSVPAWISRWNDNHPHRYFGDVFVVKVAPCENGRNGEAIYENMPRSFLDVLDKAPVSLALPSCKPTDMSSRPFFDKEAYQATRPPLATTRTKA